MRLSQKMEQLILLLTMVLGFCVLPTLPMETFFSKIAEQWKSKPKIPREILLIEAFHAKMNETRPTTPKPPIECESVLLQKAANIPMNVKYSGSYHVFVYASYIDRRVSTGAFLRVFLLAPCPKTATKIVVQIDKISIPLVLDHIEWKCPFQYATGCSYNPYIMTSSTEIPQPYNSTYTIFLESSKKLHTPMVLHPKLTHKPEDRQKGHTICVPPLYWYSDWTKIIFSMEAWKIQGATDIIVYYYSGTKDVKKVLEYYAKTDKTFTLVEWPILENGIVEDPNDFVYRIGLTVALNDCVMRSRTHYVMHVDFDEIIVPNKGTTHSYIEKKLSRNSTRIYRSLRFQHRPLIFEPELTDNFDFDGLDNMVVHKITGATKVVGLVDSIHRFSTHRIREFTHTCYKERIISPAEAKLLHHRYNYAKNVTAETSLGIKRVVPDIQFLKTKMQEARRTIFGDVAPKINSNISVILASCLENWKSVGCKTPISTCAGVMGEVAEWDTVKLDPIKKHIFTAKKKKH